MTSEYQINDFVRVSHENLCPHCGKPDWCYFLGDLTVCARDAKPATGWVKTSKQDDNGDYFYAPKTEKKVNPKGQINYVYQDRSGEKILKVVRVDDGEGSKKIYQNYWLDGAWERKKGDIASKDIPLYNHSEVQKAIQDKKDIFLVEGEKCVECLKSLGLTATTARNGLKPWIDEYTQDLKSASRIILCPDRDSIGVKKMTAIASKLEKENIPVAWLLAPPSDFFWKNLPQDNGADIADWLENGATASDIQDRITDNPTFLDSERRPEDESSQSQETEKNFNMLAYEDLYGSGRYISLGQELYRWNGNYYELLSTFDQKKRITEWCLRSSAKNRGGGYKHSYAKTSTIEEIYKWANMMNLVDPAKVNPLGINCLNGVVEITWEGNRPRFELTPPDPDKYFTYVTNFEYSPDIDRTDCDRLLAVLDAPQRDIFLKTIAASLDLNKIREFKPTGIKALLLQGTGSNGKDSLWQAVSAILGKSMTQIGFSDFQDYDRGSKFNVARLATSKICWASENSSYVSLDNVEILKQAITGEAITIEEKYQQPYQVEPKAVLLFNINQPPLINAGLEAIKRRYAVLEFNKTFVKDADNERGELEIDPRFRYDKNFLEQNIAPALLNYLLEALYSLAVEGIDYSQCESNLERIRQDSNHLWEFVRDAGIVPQKDGAIYVKDLWKKLYQWYLDTGIVEISSDRVHWNEPFRKGDSYVKGANQIYGKFKDLFPQIKKEKCTTGVMKNRIYLNNITFCSGKADGKAVTIDIYDGKAREGSLGVKTTVESLKKDLTSLQDSEKLEIALWLNSQLEKTNSKGFSAKLPYLPSLKSQNIDRGGDTAFSSAFPLPSLPDKSYDTTDSSNNEQKNSDTRHITRDKLKGKKIEFFWDDSGTCWEVTKVVFPYYIVRRSGEKITKEKKVDCFTKVQIGKQIYYLS